jgi:hypothetical protein
VRTPFPTSTNPHQLGISNKTCFKVFRTVTKIVLQIYWHSNVDVILPAADRGALYRRQFLVAVLHRSHYTQRQRG